jgi:hypothetical protein
VAVVTGAIAAACVLFGVGGSEWIRDEWLWALQLASGSCAALLLLSLPAACLSGVRAFDSERRGNTLESLVMVPRPPGEIVRSRFAAALRPHVILFSIFGGASVVASLVSISHHGLWGCWRFMWFGSLMGLAGVCYGLFSLGALGAACGLYFGLRTRTPAGAVAAAMTTALLILVAEAAAGMVLGPVLIHPYDTVWESLGYVLAAYVPEWPVPMLLLFGTLNLFATRAALGHTSRHFQTLATGERPGPWRDRPTGEPEQ